MTTTTTALRFLLSLLFLTTLSTCDRAPGELIFGEEEREGAASTQIDIREPREVAPVTRRPEFGTVSGQEAVLQVTPLVMNLLAKYELAAERALMDGYERDLLQQRADLRGAYNDFVQLGRRYNFEVPAEVPKELYVTTAALEERRGSAFFDGFERSVAQEREQLLNLLRRFERRELPQDFQRALDELRDRLQA